jgi:benzoate membrane transport protein
MADGGLTTAALIVTAVTAAASTGISMYSSSQASKSQAAIADYNRQINQQNAMWQQMAAQRAAGYTTPVSPPLVATGVMGIVLAPLGGYTFNLAAITAAICMGREAGEDPARRYTAAVAAGVFYALAGLAGAAVVGLLQAFPRELVLAVAGLALLGTIATGLATALREEMHRDAAALTFLVTLSGVSLLGVGSAFWGVVAGTIAWLVPQWRAR